MSDGPHRSLPMRPGWKKVAEHASNLAFAVEDVCDAIVVALTKDWRKEISSRFVTSIIEILGETTLFGQDKIRSILDLRQTISGSTIGTALLEFLTIAIDEGKSGRAAIQDAMIHALRDQSARCARQVEEHYLREPRMQNTLSVRRRLDKAIQAADFGSLTGQLLDRGSKSVRRIKKHDGVDDGVNL